MDASSRLDGRARMQSLPALEMLHKRGSWARQPPAVKRLDRLNHLAKPIGLTIPCLSQFSMVYDEFNPLFDHAKIFKSRYKL